MITKGKELTMFEYFQQLQLEYLSCKLRQIIYDEKSFSDQNREIAEKKQEKILNLSEKLDALSVCNSKHIALSTIRYQFIQPFGLPNLQYSTSQGNIAFWDRVHLFKEGTIVSYCDGRKFKIIKNFPNEDIVLIRNKKEEFYCPYNYVSIADRVYNILAKQF